MAVRLSVSWDGWALFQWCFGDEPLYHTSKYPSYISMFWNEPYNPYPTAEPYPTLILSILLPKAWVLFSLRPVIVVLPSSFSFFFRFFPSFYFVFLSAMCGRMVGLTVICVCRYVRVFLRGDAMHE